MRSLMRHSAGLSRRRQNGTPYVSGICAVRAGFGRILISSFMATRHPRIRIGKPGGGWLRYGGTVQKESAITLVTAHAIRSHRHRERIQHRPRTAWPRTRLPQVAEIGRSLYSALKSQGDTKKGTKKQPWSAAARLAALARRYGAQCHLTCTRGRAAILARLCRRPEAEVYDAA
jgi:hypothetical protein